MSQQGIFNMQMTCKRRHAHSEDLLSNCLFSDVHQEFCLGTGNRTLACLRQQNSSLNEETSLFGLSSVQVSCLYSKPTLTCIMSTCSLSLDLLLSPTPLFTGCLDVVFCLAQLSMAFEVLLSWMIPLYFAQSILQLCILAVSSTDGNAILWVQIWHKLDPEAYHYIY